MGEIVYSVSTLKALSGPLALFVFFTILGFSGLGMGIFKRKDKVFVRVLMGLAGMLLCLVAVVVGFLTVRSYTGGTETVSAHLNRKRAITENCDSSTSKCKRYVLEMQAGSRLYDVEVSDDAFNSVDEDACYAVTYYPNDGLFGSSGNVETYQSIGGVTQIATAACP